MIYSYNNYYYISLYIHLSYLIVTAYYNYPLMDVIDIVQ